MKKIFWAVFFVHLALFCVTLYPVETNEFSLSETIEVLVKQFNGKDHQPFKVFLIKQLEVCKDDPALLQRLPDYLPTNIKNSGSFFEQLQKITETNIRYYIQEKEKQAEQTRKWISQPHRISPTMGKAATTIQDEEQLKPKAILQVISLLQKWLSK